MKEFPAASLTRATGDLFAAASVAPVAITKHRKQRFVVMSVDWSEALTKERDSQLAVAVDDMPPELGSLLDQGLNDHLHE